jgi:hypothetical protein
MNLSSGQKTAVAVVAVLVLAAIGYAVYRTQQMAEPMPSDTAMNTNEPASTTTEATVDEVGFAPEAKKPAAPAATAKLTYQQTVEKFAGRRIQFDSCTTPQRQFTFKSGTQIMLDGKSADPQEIRIDKQVIRLDGYGYKLVTLRNTTLPHTITVDCTTAGQPAYNVTTIVLQK